MVPYPATDAAIEPPVSVKELSGSCVAKSTSTTGEAADRLQWPQRDGTNSPRERRVGDPADHRPTPAAQGYGTRQPQTVSRPTPRGVVDEREAGKEMQGPAPHGSRAPRARECGRHRGIGIGTPDRTKPNRTNAADNNGVAVAPALSGCGGGPRATRHGHTGRPARPARLLFLPLRSRS